MVEGIMSINRYFFSSLVFLFLASPCVCTFLQAQKLPKDERKKWKKKLKELTPEKYKSVMTEYYELRDQVASLEELVASCDVRIEAKDKELKEAKTELPKLRNELQVAKKELEQYKAVGGAGGDGGGERVGTPREGIVFKVQIGAYRGIDMSEHVGRENFTMEKDADINKYSVGGFLSYREADSFKKGIRRMGVKDAWVVAYKDGQRVDIKEVISSIDK